MYLSTVNSIYIYIYIAVTVNGVIMIPYGIHLSAICLEIFLISIFDMSLKIINSRLQLNLPVSNELTYPLNEMLSS